MRLATLAALWHARPWSNITARAVVMANKGGMTFQTIILQEEAGAFRLSLNRPDRLNSFSAEMHEEVARALDRVEQSKQPRVLLLTGCGRGFCAGQDLGERPVEAGPIDLTRGPDLHWNPLIRRLVALPIPVLCAVNGVAAGAGVGLALACDVVIAAESARFVPAFSKIGMSPDSGTSWALPRLVGQARAMGFALLGEPISAGEAERLGLIWRTVPDDRLATEIEDIFTRLANGPTLGLSATKRAIRAAWRHNLDEALDFERDLLAPIGASADYREGVSAFKEKRAPRYQGR